MQNEEGLQSKERAKQQSEGSYAFWDLIAQEAYLPKTLILKEHTLSIFQQKENRKNIWIFACNNACRELIHLYQHKWNIAGILDNAKAEWGKLFSGIPVYPPGQVIPKLSPENDVIILALRLHADTVVKQITDLGFSNIYSLGVLAAEMEPYRGFIKEIQAFQNAQPISDMVLMESMNDFDGNTGALYEYLKRHGSRHRFVWRLKSENAVSPFADERDTLLFPDKSIQDLKEYIRCRAMAKWEIWECDPIRKVHKDQVNVFLQHYGMGYKQVAHLYSSPDYVDYALTTNPFVHEMEKKSITYAPETRFIYGELPRNDVLFGGPWDELRKITDHSFDKVIMWAPTLRSSRVYHRVDSDIEYPYGISVIYEADKMKELNAFLVERNMLLLIKIHPRQKINYINEGYGNILYLDGESVKCVHPYKLLTEMDAMITDYSSIVFDYMLLDRPIAWALEDREHYQIEYLMDNPMEYMPGEKIYTFGDLLGFLEHVRNGEDRYQAERRKICERCNGSASGNGCKNLIESLGL